MVDIRNDFRGSRVAMSILKILIDPFYEMVLEGAFNDLMQEIGAD
jgi:hypothetical protein